MTFQALDDKGHDFMDLLDKNSNLIESYTAKGSPWLKFFGHSNLLYTRTSRAIINHIPISKCLSVHVVYTPLS